MYRRFAAALVTILIAAAWFLPGAAAQGDTTPLQVGAMLCQDTDCIDHSSLVPGFTITALDSATGDTLASCTTDAADPHTCTLDIPVDARYELAWDDTQVPGGYAWRGDLYPVADGPFGSATLIPFVPAQAPEPTVAPTAVPEPGHVTVQAGLCTDATCHEITEFLDLFIITAVDPDTGQEFSSCATGNAQQGLDHQCILDVPADGTFDLTWHDDQVPAGYVAFGDPFPVGDPAVLTLGFVPAAPPTAVPTEQPAQVPTVAPTPAPVTTLPTTGAGPDGGAYSATPVLLIAAGALLVLLVGAMRTVPVLIRRRVAR